MRTVYPRACGGTCINAKNAGGHWGLSPRVRGNPLTPVSADVTERSIPARAGEPSSDARSVAISEVYPRACGGTGFTDAGETGLDGLSPRVRGNPLEHILGLSEVGSIPARAGEPSRPSNRLTLPRVYPRACGGTRSMPRRNSSWCGLSPRVRGNPSPPATMPATTWSIPARAGEPPHPTRPRDTPAVYPRACGGTAGQHPDP